MLGARIARAVHKQGHKGALALVWGGTVGLLVLFGAGLVGAALLMGLALLIGAIWASLAVGVCLLALAAGMIALRQDHRPPPPPPAAVPLEEVIFTLGFVAARRFFRKAP